MRKHQSAYDEITQRIIAQLEAGVMPWLAPWSDKEAAKISSFIDGAPINRVSGRAYSGINVIQLWGAAADNHWPSPLQFLTYKQATELGGHVKRGEEATTVYFVGEARNKDYVPGLPGEMSSQPETYKFLKRYWVFHWSQCEGIKPRQVKAIDRRAMTEPEFSAFVSSTQAHVRVGGTEAQYVPLFDYIAMPPLGAFVAKLGEHDGAANYKSVLCHELVHWSGAKHRLQRDMSGRFGSQQYAREELIAEIGSAFLCAELGIEGQLRHAEYVGQWLKALKNDSKLIVQAASQASKASQYLLDLRDRPIAINRAVVPFDARRPARLLPVAA